jgi:RNA polymerase sigma-70 factor, ECF subfamily
MKRHAHSHLPSAGSSRRSPAGEAAASLERLPAVPLPPGDGPAHADPAPPADHDIWRPLLEGQPSAVSLLYERYGVLAFTLAYRVLNDRQAAEDVVQDAFLAVWQRAATYSAARGSLRSWLCAIVRNCAIDRTRGRAARRRLDIPFEEAIGHPDGADVCADVIRILDADRVRASMSALSTAERQTLELAYYGGHSQSEIARLMCVPLGTVKGRTRAGLGKLRRELAAAR